MAKSFSVSFNINGSMDGSLQAALKAAANAMRGLGSAAKAASAAAQASKAGLSGMATSLNQLQQAAQRYKQVQDALKQSTADFAKAGQALASAKAKYEQDAAAADKLKTKLQQLKAEQDKLGTAKSGGSSTLKQLRQDLAALKKAYADAKRAGDQMKMSTLGAQIKSTQGAITSQQAAVKQMAQSYRELSEQIRKTKADLQAADAQAQQSGAALSAQRASTQRLSQSFQNQLAALNQLRASLSSAGFSTSGFAANESRLAADIDRVNAALQRQQQLMQAQSQSAQASQEMFNAYNNFQGALDTASTIAAPFKSATENAMEFEYAMSKVKSLTQMRDIRAGNMDKVNASMAALTEQAEQLGAATEFTSNQVAQAQGFFGMAGWDADRIMAAMKQTVDLATIAGDKNIPRMADMISDIATAMGVTAGETTKLGNGKTVDAFTHFADAWAYAVTSANLNSEQLFESMKYNAAPMRQAGFSMGEIFASNMMAANAGLKGSMAGTSFRAGAIRLQAPAKAGAKALEDLGLSASDAQKEMAAAGAAMEELGINGGTMMDKVTAIKKRWDENLAAGNTDANAQMINDIFGKNSFTTWAQIMDKNTLADLQKFAAEIDSGAIEGWAEDTASVMRDNTLTSIELLKSSMDALQRSIGQALTPTVRAAAEAFAPIVDSVREFVQANPEVVQAAAAIAAALASIVVGAAAVKLAFAGWTFITSSIQLVRAALATLADGALLGGLVGKIAQLRAAFASLTLSSAASGIAATFSSIGTAIAGAARAAMAFAFSPVGAALTALALAGLYVYNNWDKVSSVFSGIGNALSGAVMPAINSAVEAFGNLAETLGMSFDSSAFQSLSDVVSSLASAVGGTLVGAFLTLAGVVGSVLSGIVTGIAGLVKTVAELGTGLTKAFYQISEGNYSDAFSTLAESGVQAAENFKNAFADAFSVTKDGIVATSQALDNYIHYDQQAKVSGGGLGAMQARVEESRPIDTSQTQAALDQVGASAQQAATNMDGVNQATQQISQAGTDVQALSTNSQQAGTQIQQLGTESQTAQTGVQALGTAADGAQGGVTNLGDSAGGAVGNISAMSEAAGAVAAALSAKATEISSIKISVPQISVAAAANAEGGIYKRGAFLTTFAEKSPEAAIPIENSARARELWTRTGQMIGMLPGDGGTPDDKLKNIERAREAERIRRQWQQDVISGKVKPAPPQETPATIQQPTSQPAPVPVPQPVQQPVTPQVQQPKVSDAEVLKREADMRKKHAEMLKYLPNTKANREYAQRLEQAQRHPPKTRAEAASIYLPESKPKRGGSSIDIPEWAMSPTPTFPELSGGKSSGGGLGAIFDKLPTDVFGGLTTGIIGGLVNKIPSIPTGGGVIGDLIGGITGGIFPQSSSSGGSTFNVTINVTANGTDENSIRNGVESAIPSLESWAEKFAAHQHESARRSFA